MPADPRVAIIREYFRRVDTRDVSLQDLFTDDVEFSFPKFGIRRGKAGLAEFGDRMGTGLASLTHDIDGLIVHLTDSAVIVEGREAGVMTDGRVWPDGVVSQGRFCNLFTFRGLLISRVAVYVDPDFTNDDAPRLAWLRGEASPRSLAEAYFAAVGAFQAGEDQAALDRIEGFFAEDADWDIPGNNDLVPWIGPRRGRTAIRAFFTDMRRYTRPVFSRSTQSSPMA